MATIHHSSFNPTWYSVPLQFVGNIDANFLNHNFSQVTVLRSNIQQIAENQQLTVVFDDPPKQSSEHIVWFCTIGTVPMVSKLFLHNGRACLLPKSHATEMFSNFRNVHDVIGRAGLQQRVRVAKFLVCGFTYQNKEYFIWFEERIQHFRKFLQTRPPSWATTHTQRLCVSDNAAVREVQNAMLRLSRSPLVDMQGGVERVGNTTRVILSDIETASTFAKFGHNELECVEAIRRHNAPPAPARRRNHCVIL